MIEPNDHIGEYEATTADQMMSILLPGTAFSLAAIIAGYDTGGVMLFLFVLLVAILSPLLGE